MVIEQLRKARNRQPFVRFLIHLADGQVLTVRHPELLAFSDEIVMVLEPREGTHIVDTDQIVSIETPRRSRRTG